MAKRKAFQVPTARDERFYFRVPGEDTDRSLPLMTSLPAGTRHKMATIAGRLAASDDSEETRVALGLEAEEMQHDLVSEQCPGLLDVVTGDQLDAIIAAWGEASGQVSLGE